MRFYLLGILFLAVQAQSAEVYQADQFMKDVRANNLEVKSAMQAAEGAKKRAEESDLITSPQFFTQAQAGADSKLPILAFFNYDRLETQGVSLGVSQLTTYGQQIKVAYNAVHYKYVNLLFGTGGPNPATDFFDTTPTIEISQALWGNGFGRGTRANVTLIEAQAKAVSYGNAFKARAALATAEESYWKLVIAREKVAIQTVALEQAKKIYDWSAGRAKRNLGDNADALQARAALEGRGLEMQLARDEERMAARLFNRARHVDSDEVKEKLEELPLERLTKLKAEKRAEKRDDVRAAEEQQKAAIAGAMASSEKDRPTFDITGSLALNGRNAQFGTALGDPFSAKRPTWTIAAKLVIPLDRSAANDAAAGWELERRAAELLYQHKLSEQEQDWNDVGKKLSEAQRRLELASQLVEAQKTKLEYERARLKQGRTITFQVLSFEQDYAQAQLMQLQAEAVLVGLNSYLRLFDGGEL